MKITDLLIGAATYILTLREGESMFKKRRYVYLTEEETRIVLNSLFCLRNAVISKGGYGDCVNELIEHVINAPLVKI